MSRINLLKEKDIELFDNPIELSNEERKILFTLEFDGELDPNLRKGITTVGYILQKGYFLAQKKFFVPNQFKKDDINYVSKLCGLDEKINILEYKNEILEDKDYVVIFDVENGEVKSINLGCYN